MTTKLLSACIIRFLQTAIEQIEQLGFAYQDKPNYKGLEDSHRSSIDNCVKASKLIRQAIVLIREES